MTIDTQLLLFDFDESYATDAESALNGLTKLLSDEATCRARVEMQTRWRREARQRFPEVDRQPREDEFARELEILWHEDAKTAVSSGRIPPDRMGQLLRHAEALWEAHLTVAERAKEGSNAVNAEHYESDTSVGGSQPTMAHSCTHFWQRQDWSALASMFRPFIPAILHHVGIGGEHADEWWQFLVAEARSHAVQPGDRFRDYAGTSLQRFAERRGLGPVRLLSSEDWQAIVTRKAIETVLDECPPGDPDWAREFCRAARAAGVASWQQLQLFSPPADVARHSAFPEYRRDLVVEIRRAERVDAAWLELA